MKGQDEHSETELERFFSKLVDEFERRYDYTEKKRKIHSILKQLPQGASLARFKMEFEPFEKGAIASVLRFDPESMSDFVDHGLLEVRSHNDLVKHVRSIFGFRRKFRVDEYTVSVVLNAGKYFFAYVLSDVLSPRMAIPYLDFSLFHNFMEFVETRCSGYKDELYSYVAHSKERMRGTGVFIDFRPTPPPVDPSKEEYLREFYSLTTKTPSALIDLPFKLEIPDKKYPFTYERREGELRTLTLTAPFQGGRPAMLRIVTGMPFTRAMIVYPFKESEADAMLYKSILILNWVIENYRSVSGEFYVPDLRQYDIKEYAVTHPRFGWSIGAHFKFWSPHAKQPPPTEKKVEEELQQMLSEGQTTPIERLLLMNARRHYYQSRFNYAVLEAVIALEISLFAFLAKRMSCKGLSEKKVISHLRDTGITQALEVTLPTVTQDESILELIAECKGAVTLRNKIVHQGLREIGKGEVDSKLEKIESLIRVIEESR